MFDSPPRNAGASSGDGAALGDSNAAIVEGLKNIFSMSPATGDWSEDEKSKRAALVTASDHYAPKAFKMQPAEIDAMLKKKRNETLHTVKLVGCATVTACTEFLAKYLFWTYICLSHDSEVTAESCCAAFKLSFEYIAFATAMMQTHKIELIQYMDIVATSIVSGPMTTGNYLQTTNTNLIVFLNSLLLPDLRDRWSRCAMESQLKAGAAALASLQSQISASSSSSAANAYGASSANAFNNVRGRERDRTTDRVETVEMRALKDYREPNGLRGSQCCFKWLTGVIRPRANTCSVGCGFCNKLVANGKANQLPRTLEHARLLKAAFPGILGAWEPEFCTPAPAAPAAAPAAAAAAAA